MPLGIRGGAGVGCWGSTKQVALLSFWDRGCESACSNGPSSIRGAVSPESSVPWLPCMSGDESPQRHRLTRQRGPLWGVPPLGASASRASMEALDIMCLVPSFHESSSPAFSSCDTRAELTPSIRAASTAVTAGMSPSSRLTATAIILPPCLRLHVRSLAREVQCRPNQRTRIPIRKPGKTSSNGE